MEEDSETKRIEAISPDQIPEEEEEDLRFDFEEDTKREPAGRSGSGDRSATANREKTRSARKT